MGYTHYFYTPEKFETEAFAHFALDVQKILEYVENELSIDLANGRGESGTRPEVSLKKIRFNGSNAQTPGAWTTSESITLPWPSKEASVNEMVADPIASKRAGSWYAGDTLTQRTAPIDKKTGKGRGSYETLLIPAHADYKNPDGEYFNCVKTGYRPYDIAVTAVLIAFKHHFGDQVTVKSDGEEKDWTDGRKVCQQVLGYGLETEIF